MANIYRPIPGWRPSTPEIVADDFPSLAASHSALAIHFWAGWNGVDPPLDRSIRVITGRFDGRVYFVSIDIDRAENRPLWDQCGIANVPTVALFRGEELQGLIVGLREPEQLAAEIEKLLAKEPQSHVRRFWRRLCPF
jgi:thioredoxin-like negative regulator of GroEL